MNKLNKDSFFSKNSIFNDGHVLETKKFVTESKDFQTKYKKIIKKFRKEEFDEALSLIQRSKRAYPNSPELWQLHALILQQKNKTAESIKAFEKVVDLQPGQATNYTNLGLAYEKIGNLDAALLQYQKAITIDNNSYTAFYNLGCVFLTKNDYSSAIENFKQSLKIQPDFAMSLVGLGRALEMDGKRNEGLKCFNLALKISPNSLEPRLRLALSLKSQGSFENASLIFEDLVKQYPTETKTKLFLAETYNKMGREKEALDILKSLLKIDEKNINYLYNTALSCRGLKRYEEAKVYLIKIIEIDPKNAAAQNLFAIIEQELGNGQQSAERFQKALEFSDEVAPILNNIALSYFEENKLDLAAEYYTKAFQKSGDGFEGQKTKALAISGIYYAASKMCHWAKTAVIESQFPEFGIDRETPTPFVLLRFEDNPEKQFLRAKNYKKSTKIIEGFSKTDFKKKANNLSKIKIGYFGADFHDHATMWLMAGLLRNHDKNKFEIFIFSYGKTKVGDSRDLAKSYADKFYDIENEKDEDILNLTRQLNLDIAIDLKGFTRDTRSELFSNYLAPVQINYLGYPNTMGAEHIDYIVADKTIIPEEYQSYYSEKIIYLPDTYQPNDNERVISNSGLTRSEFGVKDNEFLLCSLNQSYKITRAEFNIWMRVLSEIKDSKLMLLTSNKWANKNLLIEAEKRGIEESKLIFVPHLGHSEHLERLAVADLFVDTFNVNAHTTASDALWAGLPVVTKIGKQFAARVAASLLYSIEMPELVASNEKEYENIILELAKDKDKLVAIRKKLQTNRFKSPLFDTKRYTENFEKALIEAHQRFLFEKQIEHIEV